MNRLLAACLDVVSAGFFTFGLEEIVNDTKGKRGEVVNKAKAQAQRESGAPTCTVILIAACVGVLIGLVLRR